MTIYKKRRLNQRLKQLSYTLKGSTEIITETRPHHPLPSGMVVAGGGRRRFFSRNDKLTTTNRHSYSPITLSQRLATRTTTAHHTPPLDAQPPQWRRTAVRGGCRLVVVCGVSGDERHKRKKNDKLDTYLAMGSRHRLALLL